MNGMPRLPGRVLQIEFSLIRLPIVFPAICRLENGRKRRTTCRRRTLFDGNPDSSAVRPGLAVPRGLRLVSGVESRVAVARHLRTQIIGPRD